MNESLMFEQIRELCKLTGKACHKISSDCNIPMRLVVKQYISTMQYAFELTDAEINKQNTETKQAEQT